VANEACPGTKTQVDAPVEGGAHPAGDVEQRHDPVLHGVVALLGLCHVHGQDLDRRIGGANSGPWLNWSFRLRERSLRGRLSLSVTFLGLGAPTSLGAKSEARVADGPQDVEAEQSCRPNIHVRL
jgi:hypothetical protein